MFSRTKNILWTCPSLQQHSDSLLAIRGGDNDQRKSVTRKRDNSGLPVKHHRNSRRMKDDSPDQVIGGGAINEKKRTFLFDGVPKEPALVGNSVFQGTHNQAHFLHAMEGLDRYPNYVARWNADDSEELERALERRLEKVRQQRRDTQEQRERLQQMIQNICQQEPEWKTLLEPPQTWDEVRQSGIFDARTNSAIFRSKCFHPSLNYTVPSVPEVLAGRERVELDAGYLEEIMEEEVFDVYSFPLLSDSFCIRIQAYMQRMMVELDKTKDPDWMAGGQRSVRNLDHLGLAWLNDLLFQLVVRPISRHLYQHTEMGAGDLDWRHGFLAAYAANPNVHQPRQRLVPHTDDAEVTLNICIGDIFEGGSLQFWGLRGTDMAGKLVGEYIPQRGRALLHAGRQLHEVTEVTSGDRFALILWTRCWGGIRSTTCPCCWLNRRTNGGQASCICSARWN